MRGYVSTSKICAEFFWIVAQHKKTVHHSRSTIVESGERRVCVCLVGAQNTLTKCRERESQVALMLHRFAAAALAYLATLSAASAFSQTCKCVW
jgi:hypothetical protein